MEYEIIDDLNNMSLEEFLHKWKGICIEGTYWHDLNKRYMVFNTDDEEYAENLYFGYSIKNAISNYILGVGPQKVMNMINNHIERYNESMQFDINQKENTILK